MTINFTNDYVQNSNFGGGSLVAVQWHWRWVISSCTVTLEVGH